MFEQAVKNIDDVLWKDAGCASELDYTEQTSWLLFLKYHDALESDRALKMLKNQTEAQGDAFEQTGGFSERLMVKRIESRESQKDEASPVGPQYGKPMRYSASWRRARSGAVSPSRIATARGRHEKETRELVDRVDRIVNTVNKTGQAMNEAKARAARMDPALAAAGLGVIEGSRIWREYPITPGCIAGWAGVASR